jgi:protein-S-isoprenylcysteine O-methyltransferase Ste14
LRTGKRLAFAVIAGNVALALAAARQLSAARDLPHVMRALTIALLVLWLLCEAPLAFRVADDDQRGEDRGTLRLNGLARALALVTALAVPPLWTSWNAVETFGLVLFVAGFSLRLSAIRALGRFYSHKVRRIDGHATVAAGPYRLVRHPSYLGVIAAHLGFALVFFSWWSLGAALLLVVPAFVWRIKVEDPVLMQIPGYETYARGRARLIPRIW